jgi:hypothetical protein
MGDTYRHILVEMANEHSKELGFGGIEFEFKWHPPDVLSGHLRIVSEVNIKDTEVSKEIIRKRIISALEQIKNLTRNDLVRLSNQNEK